MQICLTLSIISHRSGVSGAILQKELRSPQHLRVVVVENGALGSTSIPVGQLTMYIYNDKKKNVNKKSLQKKLKKKQIQNTVKIF